MNLSAKISILKFVPVQRCLVSLNFSMPDNLQTLPLKCNKLAAYYSYTMLYVYVHVLCCMCVRACMSE